MFWKVRGGKPSFSGRYELGTMQSLKKKKQPIRNRVKICGKVFIPEKLFFTPLMIMGMMFSPSSRKEEKFGWNT
jgi:hypothetical protein